MEFYDFPIILGISSSPLTFIPWFFRGVGFNHQPATALISWDITLISGEDTPSTPLGKNDVTQRMDGEMVHIVKPIFGWNVQQIRGAGAPVFRHPQLVLYSWTEIWMGNFSPCAQFFPITTSANCRNQLPGRKDWNCTIFFYDVSTIEILDVTDPRVCGKNILLIGHSTICVLQYLVYAEVLLHAYMCMYIYIYIDILFYLACLCMYIYICVYTYACLYIFLPVGVVAALNRCGDFGVQWCFVWPHCYYLSSHKLGVQ